MLMTMVRAVVMAAARSGVTVLVRTGSVAVLVRAMLVRAGWRSAGRRPRGAAGEHGTAGNQGQTAEEVAHDGEPTLV